MTRILSALVLIPVVLAAIWFAPHGLFAALIGGVLVLAFVEYADLAQRSGLDVPRVASATAALAVGAAMAWPNLPLGLTLLAMLVAIGVIAVGRWQPGPHVLGSVAASAFPALYLGLPLGTIAAVRAEYGREGLLLLLVTVWVSDSAQYYAGRLFGRHKLSPTISPKKTVEGALGGLAAGVTATAVLGRWWLPGLAAWWLVGLGAVIVGLGIAGDLFESLLKRSAGVKDSSGLIPGHGGVLDRIDALLFVAPGYYLVLRLIAP